MKKTKLTQAIRRPPIIFLRYTYGRLTLKTRANCILLLHLSNMPQRLMYVFVQCMRIDFMLVSNDSIDQ